MRIILFLSFIFLKISCFANFLAVSKVGQSPNSLNFFPNKEKCELHYNEKCIDLTMKYNHQYFRVDKGALVEDLALKNTYLNSENIKESIKKSLESKLYDMEIGKKIYAQVQVSNRKKGLNKAQRRQLRKDLNDMRDDLFDGNICEVREDLLILTADGVLITSEDKASVIAFIDSLKKCN